MKLQDCLEDLAVGELSNISWIHEGVIKDNKLPAVVRFINEGLTRLYSYLELKEDELFIELYDGKRRYELTSDHNITTTADYDHYIFKGYGEPFNDNLIKILRVYTNNGKLLHLNDSTKVDSAFTPQFNVLELPVFDKRMELSVVYSAKHKTLTAGNLDDLIILPEHLFPALYAYVAYSVFSNISTQEAVQNAQKYLTTYTNIINEVVSTDSANTIQAQDNFKFIHRGWL